VRGTCDDEEEEEVEEDFCLATWAFTRGPNLFVIMRDRSREIFYSILQPPAILDFELNCNLSI
jgi:hypothetical protein